MLLQNSRVLVTGVNSGLGKYLFDMLPGCDGLNRENSGRILDSGKDYDLIIHCAFNRGEDSRDYCDYADMVEDSLLLTRRLCDLECKKMIYISSIDVYKQENNYYKLMKLLAEATVTKHSNNYLIFRCSAILGPTMRKNSLVKILECEKCYLTLSGDSTFNYILQEDVLEAINLSFASDTTGIIDFVSSDNLKLQDIGDMFGRDVTFGEYFYRTGDINNDNLISIAPSLNKTSLEVVKSFLGECYDK